MKRNLDRSKYRPLKEKIDFLFLFELSITDTGSANNSSSSKGIILISVYYFRPLTSIETSTCSYTFEISTSFFDSTACN